MRNKKTPAILKRETKLQGGPPVEQSKYDWKEIARFFLINLLGSYCYAMGVHIFTTPYQIAPGGVTGLATMINFLWGLPIGVMTFAINVPLLILSWLHISHQFTIRTAISTALLSVCTDLLVIWMPQYPSTSALAPLLASLFGGILMGIGNGLVYMGNSTTGGTAIVGALIQKRFPQFSMGKLLTGANMLIVIASIFVFGNIDSAIFAGICIYISGLVMDQLVYGMNINRLLFIISDQSSAIENRILQDLHRGVTVLKGEGGYKHSQKNVIFCVVSKSQFHKVRKLTMQVDPGAFIVGCEAGDVLGRGFRHLD